MRPISRQARRILLTLALAAGLTSELSAQYRFDHWTTENGLPENSIWGLRQTRDGYLWVTTSSAMVRFDGVRFREFNRLNTPGLANRLFEALRPEETREVGRNGRRT